MTMLLEKAARAICNSCCQECEPGDDCGGWSTWEREARAAIVAIHEHLSKPSLVMCVAAEPTLSWSVARVVWQRMLATAFEEKP